METSWDSLRLPRPKFYATSLQWKSLHHETSWGKAVYLSEEKDKSLEASAFDLTAFEKI